jgi:N-acetylmuramoyl-L-alanine amidase
MQDQRITRASGRGTTRYFWWTIGLGAVLATAFITFAPSALSPESIGNSFAGVINPTPGGGGMAAFKWRRGIRAAPPPHDSGATCEDGLTEVSINENVALQVKSILERQGYLVDLLEEYDPRLAGYKALAVVSIHTDSCQFQGDQATGFKVAASQAGTAAGASQTLTACLQNRYAARTHLPYNPGSITWDMTGYHAFSEVDPSTPVTIIEIGFMYMDRNFLRDHSDSVAQGIADGVLCFSRNEPIGTIEAATP